MNQTQNSFKKIALALVGIVILPALFYTVYEVNTLNDSEKMIEESYVQQLDVLLFSVNQYSWDYIDTWISKMEQNLLITTGHNANTDDLFKNNAVFEDLILYEKDGKRIQLNADRQNISPAVLTEADIYISQNNPLLQSLLQMKNNGYRKIVPVFFQEDSTETALDLMGLLFVSQYREQMVYTVLLLHTQTFIQQVIVNKLNAIAGSKLAVGVFNERTERTNAEDGLTYNQAIVKKKLWVFPNHSLGIGLKGESLSALAQQRLYRSIILIVLLDIIIMAAGWFVWRNIRKEVHLSQLKSDFVSNVSHELRTPLSLIRMYAESLELNRVKDPAKKMQYYRNISQESERLTQLINTILNFSRMESGKKKYTFAPCNLNQLVEDVFSVYKDHMEQNGFTHTLVLTKSELMISADANAIKEALINLIDNAIKYSPENKRILIRTGHENSTAFVEVEDSGAGIEKANQKKIFEKFYRESSGQVHNTKGSGLGLALVAHIMQAHKGEIKLSSRKSEGSCFRLVFENKA